MQDGAHPRIVVRQRASDRGDQQHHVTVPHRTTNTMTRFGIITASTGPGRRVDLVAAWVRDVAENHLAATGGDATFGIVDVAPVLIRSEARDSTLTTMLDELVAWSRALHQLRGYSSVPDTGGGVTRSRARPHTGDQFLVG